MAATRVNATLATLAMASGVTLMMRVTLTTAHNATFTPGVFMTKTQQATPVFVTMALTATASHALIFMNATLAPTPVTRMLHAPIPRELTCANATVATVVTASLAHRKNSLCFSPPVCVLLRPPTLASLSIRAVAWQWMALWMATPTWSSIMAGTLGSLLQASGRIGNSVLVTERLLT